MIGEPQSHVEPMLAANRRGAGAGDLRRSARKPEGPLGPESTPEIEMVQDADLMCEDGDQMIQE